MDPIHKSNGVQRICFSVLEVATMLGVSPKSVYRLLDRGLLRSSGALRHKLIPMASIEEFINQTSSQGGAA